MARLEGFRVHEYQKDQLQVPRLRISAQLHSMSYVLYIPFSRRKYYARKWPWWGIEQAEFNDKKLVL